MKKVVRGKGIKSIKKQHLTIGADPEFELLKRGRVVRAGNQFQGWRVGENIEIGVDGSGNELELRPRPAKTAQSFVANFKRCLKKFATEYKGYRITTEGNRFPLGGHIHIGWEGGYFWDEDFARLCEVLDDFVGKLTLDLSGAARKRTHYYGLGKIRRQSWGIEYRVPPALIFADPETLALVVKAVKGIVWKFILNKKLTYNNPPTQHDWYVVADIEKHQYEKLMNGIERLKDLVGERIDVCARWKVKPSTRKRFKPIVRFSDEWSDSIRAEVERELRRLRLRASVGVRLFGLSSSRGEVATINVRGLEKINHEMAYIDYNQMSVGLPYSFRKNGAHKEEILLALKRIIRKVANQVASE